MGIILLFILGFKRAGKQGCLLSDHGGSVRGNAMAAAAAAVLATGSVNSQGDTGRTALGSSARVFDKARFAVSCSF